MSATSRGESQRSCLAINRSANVLDCGYERKADPKKQAGDLLGAVDEHVEKQEILEAELGEVEYKDTIRRIVADLIEGHQYERLEEQIDNMRIKGNQNKKQNSRQKKTGVTTTVTADGMIPYSDLTMPLRNYDALKEELTHRGFTDFTHPMDHEIKSKRGKDKGIAFCKELEIQRVKDASGVDVEETLLKVEKAFTQQSTAVFNRKEG